MGVIIYYLVLLYTSSISFCEDHQEICFVTLRVGSYGHEKFNILEILETGLEKIEREASSFFLALERSRMLNRNLGF